MSHHIVRATHVSYTYPDKTQALRDVSFEARHGEAIALVGGNGAGKSTLLLALCGALMPDSGEIRIGDIPVVKSTLPSIRKSVGMVFQNPDDQLFMPTIMEDVCFGPLNMGMPGKDAEEHARQALDTVGLWDIRNKASHRLSGGEKRGAAIASVLAMEPDILIMDEPSTHLDPYSRRQMINFLQGFIHTRIIATHDLPLVLDLCPRVILMHGGQIIADGVTEEIFRDRELLESCRLEQPECFRQ